ncbi:uncharacterized protein LOC133460177 [Cololabis saira]|uniref:uncharacterized protein LOC133460177 n=1 Tax=Cololabis saira TaxID=129043 RepID=UPI002AD39F84|nr:uncharacterized protein LOC133460177 [Cololabis saira]
MEVGWFYWSETEQTSISRTATAADLIFNWKHDGDTGVQVFSCVRGPRCVGNLGERFSEIWRLPREHCLGGSEGRCRQQQEEEEEGEEGWSPAHTRETTGRAAASRRAPPGLRALLFVRSGSRRAPVWLPHSRLPLRGLRRVYRRRHVGDGRTGGLKLTRQQRTTLSRGFAVWRVCASMLRSGPAAAAGAAGAAGGGRIQSETVAVRRRTPRPGIHRFFFFLFLFLNPR